MHAALAFATFATSATCAFLAAPDARAQVQDNSFLLEEAYNQDPGVVQHIVTGELYGSRDVHDRRSGGFAVTQEWPVGSQRHQLSYTLPFLGSFRKEKAHWESVDQGIGDVQLDYRYALFFEDPLLPAVAPRFSVTLPTGDEERGLGEGFMRYELGLPVSKEIGPVALHGNAAFSLRPGADVELAGGTRSERRDLLSWMLGGSAVLLADARVQPLVEVLSVWEDAFDATGEVARTRTTWVSPGVRWGLNLRGGQLVLGLAAPVGFSEETREYGGLLYVSFEHAFARVGTGGADE